MPFIISNGKYIMYYTTKGPLYQQKMGKGGKHCWLKTISDSKPIFDI